MRKFSHLTHWRQQKIALGRRPLFQPCQNHRVVSDQGSIPTTGPRYQQWTFFPLEIGELWKKWKKLPRKVRFTVKILAAFYSMISIIWLACKIVGR